MAQGGGNIADIREAAAAAQPAPDMRGKARSTRGDRAEQVLLPPDCPVTPLGIQGLKVWVLDAANQLIQMPTDCRKGDMTLVFGGDDWLLKNFPQYTKDEAKTKPLPPASKFDQAAVQSKLITACQRRGIFNPQGRVFGRGAHRGGETDEQLLLHMGRNVIVAGGRDAKGKPGATLTEHPAGPIGESFFPALPTLPAPASEASTVEEGATLQALFGEWYFVEDSAAPLLLMGMVGQMYICGALKWRSHMWLAGPTAAGKSSLQALIRALLAQWCLHTEDASEAAIRQVLGDDTLPVMIDEAEADDNPEKQRAILNLAKKASSGAKMYRGSSDHKAQEFTAQSCFLFSSVLHSLAKGEDRNRMAILEMRQVPKTETQWEAPDLGHWRAIGRKMHRRMIEQWPRFQRTLADYKREIWSHNLEGRWQDTFGTLLACADCLLHDCAPSQESELNPEHGREKRWVQQILPLLLRGRSEARTDVDRCIAFLMSKQIPGSHGAAPETIGQWIMRAMTIVDSEKDEASGGINHVARTRLKQYGLRLALVSDDPQKGWKPHGEPLPSEEGWKGGYLLVAYATCAPLGELFRGTEWANGGWLQSLGKVPHARRGPAMKHRFSGPNPDNCIAVPLAGIRGED